MEADWSVEIGEGLPQIVVPWAAGGLGWIDLRTPGSDFDTAVRDIPLSEARPVLAAALRRLHATDSLWFTSKCDAWLIDGEDEMLDPYEFDAADLTASGVPMQGCASYLDIIARDPAVFASFPAHENLLRTLTHLLRAQRLPHARIDFVLRAARVNDTDGFAFTAYVAGCGLDAAQAQQSWTSAWEHLMRALHTC